MRALLQDDVNFTDNEVLDEWRIPFGDWYDQAVSWVDNQLKPILDFIDGLFGLLIDFVNDTVLLGVPWFVVVIAFFLIGWVVQNIRVGIFSGVALVICALMGTGYWEQTAKTIGFIAVAVLLCTVVGIPVGIMAGRVDSFWKAIRPLLDAMQVVHSFVYMLPFIYFFGIGEVGATIVTMVFALPPLDSPDEPGYPSGARRCGRGQSGLRPNRTPDPERRAVAAGASCDHDRHQPDAAAVDLHAWYRCDYGCGWSGPVHVPCAQQPGSGIVGFCWTVLLPGRRHARPHHPTRWR